MTIQYSVLQERMALGGTAGFIGTSLIYPIDTLRIKMQKTGSFSEVWKGLRGIGCLYPGYRFNLGYVVPEKALKFGVNDYLLQLRPDLNRAPTTTEYVTAGLLAGTAQSFVTTPAELLKIRMQTRPEINTLGQAYRSVPNLYRGWTTTLMRDVPFTGIFFPLYYGLKQQQFFQNEVANDLSCSLSAGIVSTALVTPPDVIKTRFQAEDKITLRETINQMPSYRTYFRGIIPRTISVSVLYAVTASVFELQKRWFC